MGSRPGRPRSERARLAVLEAARALVVRNGGLTRLTVEAVAAAAGVSKATIYRWWPGKEALVVDAFAAVIVPEVIFPDTGSLRDDLRVQMQGVVAVLTSPMSGVIASLIGASQDRPGLATAISERFIAGRRAEVADALRRATERGELRAGLDFEAVIDVLYGPLWYRFLVTRGQLDAAYVERLLALLWPAVATPPELR